MPYLDFKTKQQGQDSTCTLFWGTFKKLIFYTAEFLHIFICIFSVKFVSWNLAE